MNTVTDRVGNHRVVVHYYEGGEVVHAYLSPRPEGGDWIWSNFRGDETADPSFRYAEDPVQAARNAAMVAVEQPDEQGESMEKEIRFQDIREGQRVRVKIEREGTVTLAGEGLWLDDNDLPICRRGDGATVTLLSDAP